MGYWGYGGYGGGYDYSNYGGYPGYNFPGWNGSAGVTPNAGQAASHGSDEGEDHKSNKQHSGGVQGFFKGIANGGVNLVKGIFSPQGIVMLAGTIALTWATAGAILPLLGVIGLSVGGYQMMKGAASGDSEKAGEGFFNFALSGLGFAGPKMIKLGDTEYGMVGTGKGGKVSLRDRLKAPFGKTRYQSKGSDEALNMYQLSWRKMQSRFGGSKAVSQPASVSVMTDEAVDQIGSTVKEFKNKPVVNLSREQIESLGTRKEHSKAIFKTLDKCHRDRDALLAQIKHEKDEDKVALLKQQVAALNDDIKVHAKNLKDNVHENSMNDFLQKMEKLDKQERSLKGNKSLNLLSSSAKRVKKEQQLKTVQSQRAQAIYEFNMKRNAKLAQLNDYEHSRFLGVGQTLDTVEDGKSVKDTDEETLSTKEMLAEKLEHDRALMGELENFFEKELAAGQKLPEDYTARFEVLQKKYPAHAERLHDLWNLKVLELVEEEGPAYAQYYRGETIDYGGDVPKTIQDLKFKALMNLNNKSKMDWSLSAEQKQTLQELLSDKLIASFPEKQQEILKQMNLDSKEGHELLFTLLEKKQLTPKQNQFLNELFEDYGFSKQDRTALIEATNNVLPRADRAILGRIGSLTADERTTIRDIAQKLYHDDVQTLTDLATNVCQPLSGQDRARMQVVIRELERGYPTAEDLADRDTLTNIFNATAPLTIRNQQAIEAVIGRMPAGPHQTMLRGVLNNTKTLNPAQQQSLRAIAAKTNDADKRTLTAIAEHQGALTPVQEQSLIDISGRLDAPLTNLANRAGTLNAQDINLLRELSKKTVSSEAEKSEWQALVDLPTLDVEQKNFLKYMSKVNKAKTNEPDPCTAEEHATWKKIVETPGNFVTGLAKSGNKLEKIDAEDIKFLEKLGNAPDDQVLTPEDSKRLIRLAEDYPDSWLNSIKDWTGIGTNGNKQKLASIANMQKIPLSNLVRLSENPNITQSDRAQLDALIARHIKPEQQAKGMLTSIGSIFNSTGTGGISQVADLTATGLDKALAYKSDLIDVRASERDCIQRIINTPLLNTADREVLNNAGRLTEDHKELIDRILETPPQGLTEDDKIALGNIANKTLLTEADKQDLIRSGHPQGRFDHQWLDWKSTLPKLWTDTEQPLYGVHAGKLHGQPIDATLDASKGKAKGGKLDTKKRDAASKRDLADLQTMMDHKSYWRDKHVTFAMQQELRNYRGKLLAGEYLSSAEQVIVDQAIRDFNIYKDNKNNSWWHRHFK